MFVKLWKWHFEGMAPSAEDEIPYPPGLNNDHVDYVLLNDHCAALAEASPRWRKWPEERPEIGCADDQGFVAIDIISRNWFVAWLDAFDTIREIETGDQLRNITHWMPKSELLALLPQPPEVE